ncbi:TraR/DksA C4-type zinc finger protein [Endozoicomonas ascidiicola]|uniref:TraR/DksA C4-type zinc finger protein n=1 Tax=Endozoicomonas ascidiicola TaxID=1698521 RepID=UPI000AA9E686|nr:TraR/DksA C4-type zinc finger protein [Endozoicomonas ascidiicola]
MDEADIASDYQRREMDTLLSHRQKKQTLTVKDSADCCEECGFEIPSERQVAVPGCSLCILCATRLEQTS